MTKGGLIREWKVCRITYKLELRFFNVEGIKEVERDLGGKLGGFQMNFRGLRSKILLKT